MMVQEEDIQYRWFHIRKSGHHDSKQRGMESRNCFGHTLFTVLILILIAASGASAALNTNPPASPVKLIFIHHSVGENWLADGYGNLGIALRDNNYFVSETNYGWGPDWVGDNTDIGFWPWWFLGENSSTIMNAVYTETTADPAFTRLASDPGGENEIVMFKSCFPNSHLGGSPGDLPTWGENPIFGQDAASGSQYYTVANAKGVYNTLLSYFATRQDKLFFVITAPPLVAGDTDAAHAANARAFNNWLVNEWLHGYPYRNVAVFDFYNIMTSNGGNPDTSDAHSETGNHHRFRNGTVQHIQTVNNNTAAYPSWSNDSHPTAAGSQKATAEYIALLNVYYHCWNGTGSCPGRFLVDIKANGSNGPITVTSATPVSITVSVGSGVHTGHNADWWVAEQRGPDWSSYIYPAGWSSGINMAYQGPLFDLAPTEVMNRTLAAGDHIFYFGVDFTPDGAVSSGTLWYKPVVVRVQ